MNGTDLTVSNVYELDDFLIETMRNRKFAVEFHQDLFTLNTVYIQTGIIDTYTQHWMNVRGVSKVKK